MFEKGTFHRPDSVKETLYVITPVFNPIRYRSRWKLYKYFERHMLQSGVHLVTIEASFGARDKVIEKVSECHTVIYVQTQQELWIKENLINLALHQLPEDWQYVAWIDGDIAFTRPDWVGETIQQLQHYDVVQLFSVAIDVDSNYNPYCLNWSFMHDYINGVPDIIKEKFETGCTYYYHNEKPTSTKPWHTNRWHPGFAWAATRRAIQHLGGLIDFAILGSADHHMARALVGCVHKSRPDKASAEYKQLLNQWQQRSLQFIKKNVGYVEGTIIHYFHGAKRNRQYRSRWKILTDANYQPSTDIKRGWNGVWQLSGNKPKLRDDIKQYFRQRNEDNMDMMGVKNLNFL